MTDSTGLRLEVPFEHWQVLGMAAAEAQCDEMTYVHDGLQIALDAARVLLLNRSQGKEQTMILFGHPEGGYDAGDLERLLTEPVEAQKHDAGDLIDPFASDKTVPLELDEALKAEIIEMSEALGVDPLSFVVTAVDLRRYLQVSELHGSPILIESTGEEEYYIIASEQDEE